MYSNEDLYKDCIEKYMKNADPNERDHGLFLDKGIFENIWNSAAEYIKKMLDQGNSVNLPNIGTFSQKKYDLGISIADFVISPSLSTQYKLYNKDSNLSVRGSTSVCKLDLSEVSKISNLPLTIVSKCYSTLMSQMCEVMSKGNEVDLDFFFGRLTCENRSISFQYKRQTMDEHQSALSRMNQTSRRIDIPNPPHQKAEQPLFAYEKLRERNPKSKIQEFNKESLDDVVKSTRYETTYSPFLDSYSRTRSAIVDHDTKEKRISDQIASFFTPTASGIFIGNVADSLKEKKSSNIKKEKLMQKEYNSQDQSSSPLKTVRNTLLINPIPQESPRKKFTKIRELPSWRLDEDEKTLKPATTTSELVIPIIERIPDEILPTVLSPRSAYLIGKTKKERNNILPESKEITSIIRFKEYMNSIPVNLIPSINTKWISHILTLLPPPPNINIEDLELLMNDMIGKMQNDYCDSVKQSILYYALKDENIQKHTSIFCPPQFIGVPYGWGQSQVILAPSTEWQESTYMARDNLVNNLRVTSHHTQDLLKLWENYSTNLFCTLPETDLEAQKINWKPLDSEEFQTLIRNEIIKKHEIFEEWYSKCVDLLTKSSELKELDLPYATLVQFFDSIASLMSNQMRMQTRKSAEKFLTFFNRYKNPFVGAVDSSFASQVTLATRPAIKHTFCIKNEVVTFVLPLSESLNSITTSYDLIVTSASDFMRLEKVLGIDIPTREKLSSSKVEEEDIQDNRLIIKNILEENFKLVDQTRNLYSSYEYLLTDSKRVEEYLQSDHTVDEYTEMINKYYSCIDEMKKNLPNEVIIDASLVDCKDINIQLIQIAEKYIDTILQFIANDVIQRNTILCKRYKEISLKVATKPTTSNELVELEQFVSEVIDVEILERINQVNEMKNRLNLLFSYNFEVNDLILKPSISTYKWVHRMDDIMKESELMLHTERENLEKVFSDKREKFSKNLQNTQKNVEDFKALSDRKNTNHYVDTLQTLQSNLDLDEQTAEDLNTEEATLGWSVEPFPLLQIIRKELDPYLKLWTTIKDYQLDYNNWFRGPILELDSEEVTKNVDTYFRTLYKLSRQLETEAPIPSKVALDIRDEITEFKQNLPIINVLCNKGLRDRHWEEMANIVGFSIQPDETTSLSRLLDLGVSQYVEQLESVGETASREFSIESVLKKMKSEWEPLVFEIKAYKDTGTFILIGSALEDLQTILDDHIIKTQTMRGSPYAKPFQRDIKEWEMTLLTAQSLLDVWKKVQSNWLYLEPIFGSEDILKQMPTEGKKFKLVDGTWRTIMDQVNKNTKALDVVSIQKIVQRFEEANVLLEEIHSGLNAYLETKRLFFSRFFFLSNDELLEILSETKDPLRVRPHLKKCFEGINDLEFKPNLDIVTMISREGERIELSEIINPTRSNNAVEVWLLQLESVMRSTTKHVTEKSMIDYPNKSRTQWILQWPGQLVLMLSVLYWVKNIEKGIKEKGKKGVSDYLEQMEKDLYDLVELVRGKLNTLQRITLGALTVIDVHARDVTKDLVEKELDNINSFDWQCQLRYYWEEETVKVKMINSILDYGFEYIGNSDRLVITPLTDRCYRTLMGALHLQYGGAPEGPAGTGKTETVKDLSKALARQCVVFNCSDGLDYLAMAKFFKGLASSGAWSCFDEFNRIDLEVLSVIAQQIVAIQQAIAVKKTSFFFEGSHIQLKWTANVFITMNPGYAGRSELPDNLKALFRTVAMMVPDYTMIAEIKLYSYGFEYSRKLATKITATYKLCSEQLSSQRHYDYGMRAVISVLRAAGNLKPQFMNEDENILVLRAINDINRAKFLSQDLLLFEGITSDLFPGIKLPPPDYEFLIKAVIENIESSKLQPEPYFIEKIKQLYEMIMVRHGLMIVGNSYSGKTKCWKILQASLGDLCKRNEMPCNLHKDHELTTEDYIINPKSISLGELYGCHDEISHEWTDGVLAKVFRVCATDIQPIRKWIVFDGPVDAIWIENMNTVLDDNKKLCLNSGEIITMTDYMTLMFEPENLDVASPATVSRVGMIFMQPEKLGWGCIFASWLDTLPEIIKNTPSYKETIVQLFEWLITPCIHFIKKKLKMMIQLSDVMLIVNCMKIMYYIMIPVFSNTELMTMAQEKEVISWIECYFLFSLTWSIGAVLDLNSRLQFSDYLQKLVEGSVPDVQKMRKITTYYTKDTPYDYTFLPQQNGKWKKWTDIIEDDTILSTLQYNEIIVPTVDTIRYTFLMKMALDNEFPILFVGPTGTGKSVYINHLLLSLSTEKYRTISLGFSAQTTSRSTQSVIDLKLDRRGRGMFGPPPGMKCIVFVDDLNMPEVERYGAQPPIELLRQSLDQGGWYDLKEIAFKTFVDVNYFAAMGPPGGGRNNISARLTRHFIVIGMSEMETSTMNRIYTKILQDWWVKSNNLNSVISRNCAAIISATTEVYSSALESLLPTPAKSHYTFNLRDFNRVIQGITMADTSNATEENSRDFIIRLWSHETFRSFGDRLVDDTDRIWFLNLIREIVPKHFKQKFDDVFIHLDNNNDSKVDTLEELRGLLFGDYLIPGADPRKYSEVTDIEGLANLMKNYLEEYNAMSTKPMNLVLFGYAMEHASRISRILKIPGGHAMLVGVGGSGKKSMCYLASHMAEYDVFTIEISKQYGVNEWREDIKNLMMKTGLEGKKTVFLFSDTQIITSKFIEDINNLLNSGEVPNIFPADEKATLLDKLRPVVKSQGKNLDSQNELYAFFIDRVKSNLHIVLAFSPVGDAFRNRIRQFPSLVNCCTIDWYSAWPNDALINVAEKFLSDVEMTEETRDSCVKLCMQFHDESHILSAEYLNELRRHYYVTPTSYLELITTFKSLLGKKRDEVSMQKKRYDIGLEKLHFTSKQVEVMQKELEDLQPILVQKTQETDEMIQIVDKQTIEAEEQQVIIAAAEKVANEKAQATKVIKDECESQLALALPALQEATDALNCLNKNDITEIKTMQKPPNGVKMVMETLCILNDVKPARVQDPEDITKKINDYWDVSKKVFLNDMQFLNKLLKFDTANLPPTIIQKLKPYIDSPDFKPSVIANASVAAKSLCMWVRAQYSYYIISLDVRPKQELLRIKEEEYGQVMNELSIKQEDLKRIMDKLENLRQLLRQKQTEKQNLQTQIEVCEAKLIRAEKLLQGLGGENQRWTDSSEKLGINFTNLTGDMILSAGFIAYLGAFTSEFRLKAIKIWKDLVKEYKVPCSENYQLVDTLGDLVKIREWQINGLPRDNYSTENGIILANSRRWPLMIDPQGQANKWIRKQHKDQLKVIKLSDGDYLRTLENALQFGAPVLLENINENLDPALEPLLLKQIFKKNGVMHIKLGDAIVEYSNQFLFYITTKLRNPHYLPEISVKVALLNFMITPTGLEDQMLGNVVAKELPELEIEKNRCILESAENKKQLKEIEDKILHVLSSSQGNILDDSTAIDILTKSKIVSDEISEKQIIADRTERDIDKARLGYVPVAERASILFFCITDLANIEPMYQYSLLWFVNIYNNVIINTAKGENLVERVKNLNDSLTFSIYNNVCRSLFEKDKLLFSFLMCTKILMNTSNQTDVSPLEWRFLLTGGVSTSDTPINPVSKWLSDRSWGEIYRLSICSKTLEDLRTSIRNDSQSWKQFYDQLEPQNENLPLGWEEKINSFQKLCILRALRPDKIIPAIQRFVIKMMDNRYIEPPPFDLQGGFSESNPLSPIIFILSPGSDPMLTITKYAEISKRTLHSLSLGQGQGPIAESLIETSIKDGSWVVLQNCHLYASWMPKLEAICENFNPNTIHHNFRLWLTSYPSHLFPVTILQNGVKLTNEPPKGLRANLIGSYLKDPITDPAFYNECQRPKEFHKLLFGLCFFHAIVQERRQFGPLGWNIPYEFNESDLRISIRQLKMFLDESVGKEIPFSALNYLTGECNYGGRVTEDLDRRCLRSIITSYYTPKIFDSEYKFSESGVYYAPETETIEEMVAYIEALPLSVKPEVFGMHENADITKDQNETFKLFDSILLTQPRSSAGGGISSEDVVIQVSKDILKKLPNLFDIEEIQKNYPILYEECLNTVLLQELGRYNILLQVIKDSLTDVVKAIKGLVVMNSELENVFDSIFDGKIPELWKSKSYPSLKPLSSYIKNLQERLSFFQDWILNGPPIIFNLSSLFFTQSFLTGIRQNYARAKTIPIDTIDFDFQVILKNNTILSSKPEEGAFINGLFFDAARWNEEKMTLDDPEPKVLNCKAPIIWLKPCRISDMPEYQHYMCPVYKTSERRGILSTTGHSTNYVLPIKLVTDKDPSYWIKRGVAMLTQLDD